MPNLKEAIEMNEKIIVITGATGGIGFEAALALAAGGANVIVTGRNVERGQAAVERLRLDSGNPRVWAFYADHASMDENRGFAEELRAKLPRIDVLINNAGALVAERCETDEGLELTMAVNHFAPFVLTLELLELLRAGHDARVLNITGGAPPMAKLPLDDLEFRNRYLAMDAYNSAKLASMALSLELGRRLSGTGVSLHVVYPGAAATSMTQNITPSMVPWFMRLLWPLFKVMMKTMKPGKAAKSIVWAATAAELSAPAYVQSAGRLGKVPAKAQQSDNVDHLWHWTLERLDWAGEDVRSRLNGKGASRRKG